MSALIVLVTLPLIPVFGILVGLATQERARSQWRALACAVRALPGRDARAADAGRVPPGRAQSATIRAVTDRYRRRTLQTLQIAFASSAVLELVATLSVALVAVTVGVRLARGDLDLETALVVLLLAPEAYWPLRRVGMEFHAAAEGVATFEAASELTDADDATPRRRPGALRARARVRAATRPRRTRPRRRQPGRPRPRRARGHRTVRLRQVHAPRGARRAARADVRHRARPHPRPDRLAAAAAGVRRRDGRRQPAPRGTRPRATTSSGPRCARSPCRSDLRRPGSARTAPPCPRASEPAWRWPGWCSRTGPTCCSTSRPRTSTRTPSG